MGYRYTPTYYSAFQDTVSTLCKSILLPFSHKSRRLPGAAEKKLAKRQTDNLKWQQDSFHRILHLIGLQKEGIVPDSDVSAFRSHLLDTLAASPSDPDPTGVTRDKLLFLQELFHAKCISAEEYHASKRPLLQRLAVQGVEIDCRDVIIGDPGAAPEEEWSVIDLRDKEEKNTSAIKHRSPIKSLIGKSWRGKGKKDPLGLINDENQKINEGPSVLMTESSPLVTPAKSEKAKRMPFRALFQKELQDEHGNKGLAPDVEERGTKPYKKQWGFDGFKKWKKGSSEDETEAPYLPAGERSDDTSSIKCSLVASPIGEGPDTKGIKKKLHSDGSALDFFIDKVLGENIKKELSRIQSELSATNPNLNFSDEQIETISTRLPVDKSDLKNFFPKPWCDRYGEVVLNVVRNEFKDHVGEMETLRAAAREKQCESKDWVSFEDNEENFHPSLLSGGLNSSSIHVANTVIGKPKDMENIFANNPFHDDKNPFWTPRW